MENAVVLSCNCLSVNRDSYCVTYYYNGSVNASGGWIGTLDNLVAKVEKWSCDGWDRKQIYIKITEEDKDEEDIRFTMCVYDQLLKCGVDVLLWDSEGEGD